MNTLAPIFNDLRRGKMIILTDDEDRENEGDLVCAAETITPEKIAFMARFGRGLICAPLTEDRAKALALAPMVEKNTSLHQCNFTVSVDARNGVTTGISAHDRAVTIRALLNPATKPEELSRPGHVFPLVAKNGGLLERKGHTEGAIELMKRAGMKEAAVICEIMGNDGQMLRGKKLKAFARAHKLKIVSVQSLMAELNTGSAKQSTHRFTSAKSALLLVREVTALLPTAYGDFTATIYTANGDPKEHVALSLGSYAAGNSVLVRVHSECLTGDVFHSRRCDCNFQLDWALKRIAKEGTGVLLYMRHEGRGIGLVNKLKAYNLQDQGYDTVEANEKLGFKGDAREYALAASILKELGISKVRLMTNNPQKIQELEASGIAIVERIPVEITPRSTRERGYLRTKKTKLGHLISNV